VAASCVAGCEQRSVKEFPYIPFTAACAQRGRDEFNIAASSRCGHRRNHGRSIAVAIACSLNLHRCTTCRREPLVCTDREVRPRTSRQHSLSCAVPAESIVQPDGASSVRRKCSETRYGGRAPAAASWQRRLWHTLALLHWKVAASNPHAQLDARCLTCMQPLLLWPPAVMCCWLGSCCMPAWHPSYRLRDGTLWLVYAVLVSDDARCKCSRVKRTSGAAVAMRTEAHHRHKCVGCPVMSAGLQPSPSLCCKLLLLPHAVRICGAPAADWCDAGTRVAAHPTGASHAAHSCAAWGMCHELYALRLAGLSPPLRDEPSGTNAHQRGETSV
jgi:hypothetical protein